MISKESKSNFNMLKAAFSNDDVAMVLCKDKKGRKFEAICTVQSNPDNPDENRYIPFALMITPTFYPLMNRLQPPALYGEWTWDDD